MIAAMFQAGPIGLPSLAALAFGGLSFAVALLAARRRAPADASGTRSSASWIGIFLQALSYAAVGAGAIHVTLDPIGARALVVAAIVLALMTAALMLFVWASRTMDRNWSLVARTRQDHQLVQAGPFAHVRHPIYVAMALALVAVAVAWGHERQLLLGIPIFVLGTWVRVRSEEALLRRQFAGAYDAYAARVRRFVPGLF